MSETAENIAVARPRTGATLLALFLVIALLTSVRLAWTLVVQARTRQVAEQVLASHEDVKTARNVFQVLVLQALAEGRPVESAQYVEPLRRARERLAALDPSDPSLRPIIALFIEGIDIRLKSGGEFLDWFRGQGGPELSTRSQELRAAEPQSDRRLAEACRGMAGWMRSKPGVFRQVDIVRWEIEAKSWEDRLLDTSNPEPGAGGD